MSTSTIDQHSYALIDPNHNVEADPNIFDFTPKKKDSKDQGNKKLPPAVN